MELITPRLVLREFCSEDAEALFAIYADAEVGRYEHDVLTQAEMEQYFSLALADIGATPRTRYRFAITVAPSDELRGWVHLRLVNALIREYEIGWSMCRADWGQGYAPEAAQEVLGFAFQRLKAHRVVAFCHSDNLASRRVMEKLGMQAEGLLRETRQLNNAWWDERVYAILEREFSYSPRRRT